MRRLFAIPLILFLALSSVAIGNSQTLDLLQANILGATSLPASGTGTVPVRMQLLQNGAAVAAKIPVRAEILGGDARFTAGSASYDVLTDTLGQVTLPLMPGTKAGLVSIALRLEDRTISCTVMLTAVDAPPLVVGYATGGMGPVPGWIEAPDAANNGTNARRGAISVYGTGKIARNTRGTFAYDSTDALVASLDTGPFIDNPNDRPFPAYGDTSLRYDDALSTSRFYGRIENGRSSAMWGEFYAHAAPSTAVGGYTMLVNGAHLVAQGNDVRASAFTARNNIAYDRQIISPTGLAIASQMLHPDIVVGSDVVQLIHLDRRTGAIISQTPLIRGSDYVVDYASGLLRFLNIILPYDSAFNPQLVVAQYEYGGPGAHSTMLGGNASVKVGRTGSIGAWYLDDALGTGNLTLLGQSLSGSTSNAAWSLSHEHSNGVLPLTTFDYGTVGDAYAESLHTHSKRLRASIVASQTGAGYDNPYGSYNTPGLVALRSHVVVNVGSRSDLDLAYLYGRNTLPATLQSQAVKNSDVSVGATLGVHPSHRLSYHIGIKVDAASSNGVVNPAMLLTGTTPSSGQNSFFPPLFAVTTYQAGSGHSIDADYGIDWKFAPRAEASISRTSPLGSTVDPYDPPQTQAEVDVQTGHNGKAFIRQLWQRTSVQALAATQSVQTASASASSSTSVGFEQQVGAATFQSGYAVDHTINGTDLFDALGVRGRVLAGKRLTADGFLQVGQELFSSYGPLLGATSPYFIVAGTSLAYQEKTFHATGQVQVRTGYDAGSTLQLGATGPISPAVSLYGAFTGSFTQYVRDSETRLGLSYRPTRNDRYVTLFSVDSAQSNLTNYNAYVTNVAQVQELYRPSRRTELAGSLAYKLTGDSFFSPGTSILGLRVDQRIGSRLDIGSEFHKSDTAPLNGTRATGFALEAGYRVGSTLRAAVGYNFSGFADPAASVNPTHRGIYLTVSSYVDRIFGWGKDKRR